jgi:hypothetical protein
MSSKFAVGDKVRFSQRCPQYVRRILRARTRTVVCVLYDNVRQCNYYDLGDRGKQAQGLRLRSYMLIHASLGLKRAWGEKKTRYRFLLNDHNQNLSEKQSAAILNHYPRQNQG